MTASTRPGLRRRMTLLLGAVACLSLGDGARPSEASPPPAFFHQTVPSGTEQLAIILPEASVHLTPSIDAHGLRAEAIVSCRGSMPVDACRRAADALRWETQTDGAEFHWQLQAGPSVHAPKRSVFGRSKMGWAEVELRLEVPARLPLRVQMAGSGSLSIDPPLAALAADVGEGAVDFRVDRATLGSLRIEASEWALPRHARRKAREPVALAGDGQVEVSLRAVTVRLQGDLPDRVSGPSRGTGETPVEPVASAGWAGLLARLLRRRTGDDRPVPPRSPPPILGSDEFLLPEALERASNRDLVAGGLHLGRWQRDEAFFTLARMSFVLGEHHAVHRSDASAYAAILSRILFRLRGLEAEAPPFEPPEMVALERSLETACKTPQKEPVARAVKVAATTSLYLIFRREADRANDVAPWSTSSLPPLGSGAFVDLPSPDLGAGGQ